MYKRLKGTYDITPEESDFYFGIQNTLESIVKNYG